LFCCRFLSSLQARHGYGRERWKDKYCSLPIFHKGSVVNTGEKDRKRKIVHFPSSSREVWLVEYLFFFLEKASANGSGPIYYSSNISDKLLGFVGP